VSRLVKAVSRDQIRLVYQNSCLLVNGSAEPKRYGGTEKEKKRKRNEETARELRHERSA